MEASEPIQHHEMPKMAATHLQQLTGGSLAGDGEEHMSDPGSKRGGWITFPFITGAIAGLTLAGGGVVTNLIVYLIGKFHVKSIDAAQISNAVNGCSNLFPVIGAIIADSFLGCFSVISISSCFSLLGTILLTLTATLDSLRPQPCDNENIGSTTFCRETPSKLQFAVLYAGIALVALGIGGTRFTIATMGANQLNEPKDQAIFFNWYFFTLYTSAVISATAIVYVEDNVSWGWGFGLCIGANLIGLAVFLVGKRFYRHVVKPQGSPFVALARVVVATFRKRQVIVSSQSEDYYYGLDGVTNMHIVPAAPPTKSFRFLNRAALKTDGDIGLDGLMAKPWKLCTVQQVEDLKALIRIFPLWSTSILLSTPIAIQGSMTVIQVLTMDRHLGPHFKIPAGSIVVIVLISSSISLTVIDRFLCPMWEKLTHQSPTPLQRVGVGHVLNVLSMVVSALVESKRLNVAQSHHLQAQPDSIVPMLALWLFPQLALVGIAEAFHFPGQVALYYQEFPTSLRSTAIAMISMIIGIAYYLGTAVIDLVRRVTGWLPDNINNGRLDYVYWIVVVVAVLNFGFYLVCAKLYKYQNVEKGEDSYGPLARKVDGEQSKRVGALKVGGI